MDRLLFFHMQDATIIAFGGREPICCIIKPIKERLPALLLGMRSSKKIYEYQAYFYSQPKERAKSMTQ